jgi:branched-chain amino acid transport system ATP-binding protein
MPPADTKKIVDMLRKLASVGIAVVIIEHNMLTVQMASDKVFVLNNGENLAEGTPLEIARSHQVIEAYLGKKRAKSFLR